MKIYVDKIPKSCAECDCSYTDYAYDDEIRCCKLQRGFIALYNNKFPECPLKTIHSHDKEVRKQVCDEIRNTILDVSNGCWSYFKDGTSYMPGNDLEDLLDQIDKGE